MTDREELLQIAEEHPEIKPLLIESIETFLREKEAALQLYPNMAEEEAIELLKITARRCFNKYKLKQAAI